MTVDPKLKEWATDVQSRYIDAVNEHGGQIKAAKALNCDRSTVGKAIRAVYKKAALHGYAPDYGLTNPVPPGQRLKGASTLYGPNGEIKVQWIKTREDVDQIEAILREVVETLKEELPHETPVEPPRNTLDDLLNLYIITDYHIGMRSWHEETGADWDIKIAENLLVGWFERAIKSSPPSKVGVFAQLGDFMHWDGLKAVTPTSGHVVDADTRFRLLVRIAIGAVRRIISMLLKKHEHVHVILAEGNHDEASSIWLSELFSEFYSDEPRVSVDINGDIYYCYEHGLTSLFFHHGHRRKPEQVDASFAGKFRAVFGRTKYSYAHMGHMHHLKSIETNLMIVEQHRTLAAADAYSSRLGHTSGRDANVITYSKQFGQVGRITISPEMV